MDKIIGLNLLTFSVCMSIFLILFWLAADNLPSVISEIRMNIQIKRSARAAEESRKRYWAAKDAEPTMQIRLRDLPQQKTPSWARD